MRAERDTTQNESSSAGLLKVFDGRFLRRALVGFALWSLIGCGGGGFRGLSTSGTEASTTPQTQSDSSLPPTPTATPTPAPTPAPSPSPSTPTNPTTPAVSPTPLPPLPSFVVGYNQAWFKSDYGSGLTSNFDLDYVNRMFDGIVAGGGYVVRLWLLENQQGLQLATYAPQTLGLEPRFLQNLELVLQAARARGLRVYLTVLDANGSMPAENGAARDYYFNLLNNKYGEQDAFEQQALRPLFGLLNAYQEIVYGIDLVNEPEAAVSRGYFPDPVNGLRDWIRRTATFVKSVSPWARVTVGTGWTRNIAEITGGLFSGLGLDFYDIHVYSDSGTFAGATALCARARADGLPIILGEYGQQTHVEDDQLQYNVTATFLANSKALCFSAAFAWRYDSAEQWWHYRNDDGSLRPAAQLIKQYGRP